MNRFIELSASAIRLGALQWEGEDLEEVKRRSDTREIMVKIYPRWFSQADVGTQLGDPARPWKNWDGPTSTNQEEIFNEMIDHDLEESRKKADLTRKGFQVVGPTE